MTNRCFVGDTRDGMREFIADGVRVQTVVTSPPYWGLRDYGTAAWDGGNPACDHGAAYVEQRQQAAQVSVDGGKPGSLRDKPRTECKCGARRIDRQLGLESTPDEYVANMVEVFRCVRDLLADDGTLWLNIGDSYAGSWGNQWRKDERGTQRPINGEMMQPVHDGRYPANGSGTGSLERTPGLKPKDLVGIPWRLAFALQADGWYLRSDIIWAKKNCMPESVTDRPTKSHEYLFLLTKSPTYYYDADAIAEPATYPDGPGNVRPCKGAEDVGFEIRGNLHNIGPRQTRNRRTVWTVATQPYAEAHFATFPRALVEPCILAGSRPGDIVFDPFMGSGTVGQVAQDLGRRWVGCELNPQYVDLQARRTAQQGLALA